MAILSYIHAYIIIVIRNQFIFCKEVEATQNAECCKLYDRGSLKFFRGRLLNEHPGDFVFFSSGLLEKGAQFFLGRFDLYRNWYGSNFIVFSL